MALRFGMTFKKWKYNLLVIALIAIIGFYIGMSFFVFEDSVPGAQQGDSSGSVLPDDEVPPPDIEIDDDEEDYGEEIVLPTDPLKLVNYGISLINDGKGYQSTFSQTITNTAKTPVGDVVATQYIVGDLSKGVNAQGQQVSVENLYFYSFETGLAADQVANYYRGVYVNYDTQKGQIATTSAYNYTDKTYDLSQASRNDKDVSISAVTDEFGYIQAEGIPLTLNVKNATVTSNNTNKSKIYQYVTIVFDRASLSEGYKNYWLSNGQLSNLQYTSDVTFEFTIHKETGAITQINRTESFNANVNYGGMNVTVATKVVTIQNFSAVNKTLTLVDQL